MERRALTLHERGRKTDLFRIMKKRGREHLWRDDVNAAHDGSFLGKA
jgi:hypothetical protein